MRFGLLQSQVPLVDSLAWLLVNRYALDHAGELARTSMAIESDGGTFTPFGLSTTASAPARAILSQVFSYKGVVLRFRFPHAEIERDFRLARSFSVILALETLLLVGQIRMFLLFALLVCPVVHCWTWTHASARQPTIHALAFLTLRTRRCQC